MIFTKLKSEVRVYFSLSIVLIETDNTLLTLQTPQATVHSSLVADAWFAWHSIPIKITINQLQ